MRGFKIETLLRINGKGNKKPFLWVGHYSLEGGERFVQEKESITGKKCGKKTTHVPRKKQ